MQKLVPRVTCRRYKEQYFSAKIPFPHATMSVSVPYYTLFRSPHSQALDKAKEAARKERMLCKQREQAQLTDQINFDLTYCVS